jgi:EmrB/QacA subfamily drug resistance transporter
MPRATAGELSRRRRFLVLAICCSSVIVVVMDISIVNVALPAIRHDLHASESGLQWTVDAYTLMLASFLVLAGSTADRVGRRRIFQIGLAAFGLGSLLCGLAPGIGWLIAARALQAVGGTMLNPVAMAIVATTFPEPAERARAIGVFGSMAGLSLALGPILGGALVDGFGWHSIFWINVPVVSAAMVCTALFVPESRAARARRFDPVGQALVILVLGSVVYAIIESTWLGWTSPVILGLLAVAALGVLGILGYEPRRVDPLLELRLSRSVPFSSAILMALWALCGFSAFLFVTTQYLQDVRGMSALVAGLCLLPVGVLVVVLSPFTGRLVGARGPRLPLVVAGAALALGGGASIWLGPATPLPAVLAIYVLFGIFLGTVNPPITNTAVSGMPRSMAGVATSLASAGRQTGTTLGVAISGTIVGSALTRGGVAFTSAAHAVWWMVLGLGLGILVLGMLSTGRWARGTAARAAALFEDVDTGAAAGARHTVPAGPPSRGSGPSSVMPIMYIMLSKLTGSRFRAVPGCPVSSNLVQSQRPLGQRGPGSRRCRGQRALPPGAGRLRCRGRV